MDIYKLQIFLSVLEFKNLTKAAESLGYTQSGVTHILNSIETDVGFRLLKRTRTGVSLTQEGEQLVPYFYELVKVHQNMENKAMKIKGLAQGSIRIGSFTSVTLYYLPEILRVFLNKHPNINVILMKGNNSDMEKALDEGTIDVAFLSLQDYHRYDFIELMLDPMCAVMSPENPLAQFDPLPIEKLNDTSTLRFLAPTGCDNDAEKIWAKISPKVVYTTNFDFSLISMARQNLGVCIVPGLIAQHDKEGVVIRRLTPPHYRTLGIAIPSVTNAPPVVKLFIECSKSVIGAILDFV